MDLRFEKYEGLGNDFLVIDALDVDGAAARSLAARLCDRHRGVGGDGVLFVALGARPRMRVVNADGSEPEMCGNGLRCVALHLARGGRMRQDAFEIDTDAGPHRVRMHQGDLVEVSMRPASLDPAAIGLRADHPWRDEPIEVLGRTLRATAVSMGNPHVVIFEALDRAARLAIGPALESDARFEHHVNVGFATLSAGGIDLEVFERGAGWTQACGTGACAAAVAAVETGRLPRHRELAVRLPGGHLRIAVGELADPVRMAGPARHVFSGVVSI